MPKKDLVCPTPPQFIYAQNYDIIQLPERGPRPVLSSWSKPAARSFSSCFTLVSLGKYIFRNLNNASSMFSKYLRMEGEDRWGIYQSRLSLLRLDDRLDSGIFVVFVRLLDIGYRRHGHTPVELLLNKKLKGYTRLECDWSAHWTSIIIQLW